MIPQRHTKTPTETRNVAVDLFGKLDAGEILTGSPTVEEQMTGDLTIMNATINTLQLRINERQVGLGEAVQFRVSGGQPHQQYILRVMVNTSAAQHLVEYLVLKVMPDSA
jgi:hypothetical protein